MRIRIADAHHPSVFLGTKAVGGDQYTSAFVSRAWCQDEVHPGPPYKTGGPLTIRKSTFTVGYTSGGSWGNGFTAYDGRFYCPPGTQAGLIDGLPSTTPDYSSWGAVGWNRFKPGRAGASVGQFLVELRDLPLLLFRKLNSFRNLGSNYLAVEFGWLPFVRDVQAMAQQYQKLERSLAQLKRDNGRPIRRGGSVKTSSEVLSVSTGTTHYLRPVLSTLAYVSSSPPEWRTETSSEENLWFSARFRYWIPDIGTPRWERRAMARLFGAVPSISLMYELVPWSWLVDWFSNVGDVLSNVSENAAENLTADYAFLMAHKRVVRRTSAASTVKIRGLNSGPRLSASATHTVEWKQRIQAHPFGFGLTDADLSVRQLGILSALGLTRT